jgi:hypothetical protein
VCERRVNLLVYSLSLHRHSYKGFILAFSSSIHNKQTNCHTIRTAATSSSPRYRTATTSSSPTSSSPTIAATTSRSPTITNKHTAERELRTHFEQINK